MTRADLENLIRDTLQRVERSTPARRYTLDERRNLSISRTQVRLAEIDEELEHLDAVLTALIDAREQVDE
ncbi:MAG: hypothetical protein ACO32I_01300 [Candidatus Limnocylindrus sp.]